MRLAEHACEAAIDDTREIFVPGVSENTLWTILQCGNFTRFGEWVETRLLASGICTNHWYQEASAKLVALGELVAFDTDLVGAYGMFIDMSRTWLCGYGLPSGEQAHLIGVAQETIDRNTELFRAGRSVREITDKLWYPSVEDYNGYTVTAHGTDFVTSTHQFSCAKMGANRLRPDVASQLRHQCGSFCRTAQ